LIFLLVSTNSLQLTCFCLIFLYFLHPTFLITIGWWSFFMHFLQEKRRDTWCPGNLSQTHLKDVTYFFLIVHYYLWWVLYLLWFGVCLWYLSNYCNYCNHIISPLLRKNTQAFNNLYWGKLHKLVDAMAGHSEEQHYLIWFLYLVVENNLATQDT